MTGTPPAEYEWSDSSTPILDLHTQLGRTPQQNVAVSYLIPGGAWNTRHIRLEFADAFARSVTAEGNNVYVMVNESSQTSGSRGDAQQITRLNAIWADLDFKESGLKSAAEARDVIDMLSGMLNARPVAVVFSGYGLQPYWEFEEGTITEANRVYMMGLLKRWGQLVQRVASISGGHVDSVYDLPRVMRAPGTKNFKQQDSPVDTKLTIQKWSTPVGVELLEDVLHSYGFDHEDNPVDEFIIVSAPEEWEPAEHDCMWAASLVNEITAAKPEARHPWLVARAIKIEAAARYGCITNETYAELVKLLNAKFEDLIATGKDKRVAANGEVPATFTWARARVSTMDSAKLANEVGYHTHKLGELRMVGDLPKGSGNDVSSSTTGGQTMGGPGVASEGNLALVPQTREVEFGSVEESFKYTSAANGHRLAQKVDGKFIFVPNVGWYVWDGARFILDEKNAVLRAAIESVGKFAADEAGNQSAFAWAQKSLELPKLRDAVNIAATDPMVVVPARDLDNQPYELCTPGGIVTISSGALRPGDPRVDRHTKQTGVTPGRMPIPRWSAFLKQIIVDSDRINYMQELFGVAIIGEVIDHTVPLFVGVGGNGKSAILEVLVGLLGDYVITLPENFLLEKGNSEHSTEIARLRGARVALGSETRPDGKFNESRLKMLSSGDVVSARLIGKNFFDFVPSHTMILAMNHLPRVVSGGDSVFRRLRKLDFNVVVPVEQRDPKLAKKMIEEEGPGILQWMIEGARRVIARGSVLEPDSVLIATQEYREEEDHLKRFMDTRVYVSEFSGVSASEIFRNYKGWCQSEMEDAIGRTQLLREMQAKLPMVRNRARNGQHFTGIGLYEDPERK